LAWSFLTEELPGRDAPDLQVLAIHEGLERFATLDQVKGIGSAGN
jgi:hypothetical protein